MSWVGPRSELVWSFMYFYLLLVAPNKSGIYLLFDNYLSGPEKNVPTGENTALHMPEEKLNF